jgi:hypothetical protein
MDQSQEFYEKKMFLERQIKELMQDTQSNKEKLDYFQRELNLLVSPVRESISNNQQLLKG